MNRCNNFNALVARQQAYHGVQRQRIWLELTILRAAVSTLRDVGDLSTVFGMLNGCYSDEVQDPNGQVLSSPK
jgi:hypothetical protein